MHLIFDFVFLELHLQQSFFFLILVFYQTWRLIAELSFEKKLLEQHEKQLKSCQILFLDAMINGYGNHA
mgnify:CR=1 FL=1